MYPVTSRSLHRFHISTLAILLLAARVVADGPASSLPVPSPSLAAPGSTLLVNSRVLILGDSITQDGRYVDFLEYYLQKLAPGAKCDLISIGLSSETVSGLSEQTEKNPRPCVLERLDRALKAVKPSVVFACYGMNDGIYHPPAPERLAAFNAGLQTLIAQVRNSGAQLVLLTPPVFDPLPISARTVPLTAGKFGYTSPYAGYDEVLARFAAAELELKEPGLTVIDLHTPMARALAEVRLKDPAFSFAGDGVHPGDAGHLLMARIAAAGLGLKLPDNTLEAELARIAADPVFALVRDRRQLRSEAWLPFIGYTRNETYKSPSVKAAEQVAARLQAQLEAGQQPTVSKTP